MPRPLFTPRKDTVPIVQEADEPQGRYGQLLKISPSPVFDPRTVQPAASRYTDYATRPMAAYWSHLQGSRSPVTNYQSMLSNVPEEQRYHLHHGRSWRSHVLTTT